MDKKIALCSVVAVALAGCATSRAKEADSLQARVNALESQVAALNQRLDEGAGGPRTNVTPDKTRLSVRQTQKALTAAGFYKGNVDGKEGPQTKKAVKAFQQANGLKADGVVGPASSEALSRYLQE